MGPADTKKETTNEKGLTTLNDTYFKNNLNVGLEDIDPEDLPTPTLSLVQTNSVLVDESNRPLPRGTFYYKGTQSVLNEVDCAILSVTKSEFPDFSDKEVMVKTYVLLGVLEPGFKPFLMYLKRSGIGAAKDMLGQIKAAQRPMYSLRIKITADFKQGEKGTYYIPKFKVGEVRTSADEIIMLEDMAKTYGAKIKEKVNGQTQEELQEVNPDHIPF